MVLGYPQTDCCKFFLTDNCGFIAHDDNKNFVCDIDYEGHGAILNTGEHYSNVNFTKTNNERIVF